MLVSLCRADKGQRGQSWRELFHDFYVDFGRYIDYYSTLKKAWDDLKSYLGQKCPRMIASLKGASGRLLTSFFVFLQCNLNVLSICSTYYSKCQIIVVDYHSFFFFESVQQK